MNACKTPESHPDVKVGATRLGELRGNFSVAGDDHCDRSSGEQNGKRAGSAYQVREHRGQLRRQRSARAIPVVAIVGYTNAGKSTLFNTLTSAGVVGLPAPAAPAPGCGGRGHTPPQMPAAAGGDAPPPQHHASYS